MMAGTGFDALMIRDANKKPKKASDGRRTYGPGSKPAQIRPRRRKVSVDGKLWFKGRASCVLLGNVGTILAESKHFPDAFLQTVAGGGGGQGRAGWEWAKVLARTAVGRQTVTLVETGRGHKIASNSPEAAYQLDGGDRPPANTLSHQGNAAQNHGLRTGPRRAVRPIEERGNKRATVPYNQLFRSRSRDRMPLPATFLTFRSVSRRCDAWTRKERRSCRSGWHCLTTS